MTELNEIAVDDDFKSLCPPLSTAEVQQLKQNISNDGFREPLVIWREKNILVDGHNRYSLWKDDFRGDLDRQPNVVEKDFSTKDEAREWILNNQLGRRNLTRENMSLLRGELYNITKRADGGHGDQKSGDQIDTPISAETIAQQHRVSPATVKRDGRFASAIGEIRTNVGEDAKQRILAGKSGLTRKDVFEIAERPAEMQADEFEKRQRAVEKRRKNSGGRKTASSGRNRMEVTSMGPTDKSNLTSDELTQGLRQYVTSVAQQWPQDAMIGLERLLRQLAEETREMDERMRSSA
jgi:hypothetical protein